MFIVWENLLQWCFSVTYTQIGNVAIGYVL